MKKKIATKKESNNAPPLPDSEKSNLRNNIVN